MTIYLRGEKIPNPTNNSYTLNDRNYAIISVKIASSVYIDLILELSMTVLNTQCLLDAKNEVPYTDYIVIQTINLFRGSLSVSKGKV